jgi:DNA primase
VLIYDGDKAGQNATQRAIPILEKAGLHVNVLQIEGAKDPDEFLHKYGADRFKLLLEGSANRVEYQLNAIALKYDIRQDDQKVKFLQESADLIATLGSAVQREVYAGRVAEKAKISPDAMKLEVDRAFKRRTNKEKKQQEKIDLSPARNLQPKSRNIRYDNMKSAMAEEGIIAQALREPALLDQTGNLQDTAFSSQLLGRVYKMLKQRHDQGLEVSLAVLEDLDQDEMSHMVGVLQRHDGPVNEQAFADCVATVRAEHQAASVNSEDDLLTFRNRLQQRKGMKE